MSIIKTCFLNKEILEAGVVKRGRPEYLTPIEFNPNYPMMELSRLGGEIFQLSIIVNSFILHQDFKANITTKSEFELQLDSTESWNENDRIKFCDLTYLATCDSTFLLYQFISNQGYTEKIAVPPFDLTRNNILTGKISLPIA